MRFILNVESLPNWLADRQSGFESLGVSDRRRNFFGRLDVGDRIITYVTQTGFLDVREIAAVGTSKLGLAGNYPEGAWPWQVRTRLVVAVEPENAVKPSQLGHTKLCSGEWRQRFRQSGKMLEDDDGRAIVEAIKGAAQASK